MHAEVERLRSQQNMLKQDLVVKAVEQERQSHQKAKELVMLRKAVDTAQRRVLLLEEETRKQKQVIQLREKEAISDKQRIRELMQQPSVEKTEERATGSTPRGRGSRQSLGNSLAWNAGSARPHQSIQTQTLPLSKARAVIPPLTSSAPPARHYQWLQKLLECTSVKRQAIKELSTAQRHLLSASEQQRQLENEKMKLVQRMQVRMEAMESKADALTAAKQEIMAQIEDHASRVSSNRGGSPHMKTLLHDLARQAEEVQEEADLEELHRRLSEIDGQEQRLRAACEEDGAWTKLQMHERQAVEKIEGLLEQLRGRQDAIEARAIGRQEAYHQAVEAEEQLRNNVPDMNLVEMKAAFQRIIDVVSASGMTQQSNNHTSSVDFGSQPQKAFAGLGPDSILNTELMRESEKHGPAKVSSIGQHPSSIPHPSSHLTSGMVSSGRVTSLSGIKSRGASPSPYRPPVTTPSSSLRRRLAYHPGRVTTPGRRFQSREGQGSGAVVPGRGSWGGGEADRQAQPASPTRARSLSYGGGEIKAQAGITNRGQLSSDGVKRRQSPFVMARRQLPGRSAMHSSILDNEHTALHHSRSGRMLAWDSEGPAVQGSKHTAAHDSASSDPFAEAISLEREVTLQQLQATSSSYCTVVTVRPSKVMMYTADTANHDLLSLPCTGEAFSASVGDEFTASTRGFSKASLSSHSLQHVSSADFRPSALSVASDGSKTGQKVYSSSNDSKDKAPSCFLNSGQYEGFESHAKLQQTECTTAAAGGGLGGVLRSSLLASSTTPSKTPVLHPFWSALKPQQRAIMSDWGTPDVYSKVQD
ncbi:hypothetical protein CEUSTIGMA_g9648.t1 [Chlamydomonas eustigma]|uniref:Uncharacterized protein n=1 Tax=Chlamydomonas eustigma TaxID=1157962 RepID=A0A250XHE5_9CHLO|nr:hypothetical protein CEUSTIGMA_g9648.t1 [Chlamydomonas eustigma]|eukprot:GAX82220.1 hypothetical protein CEUSTIGMA_g9648.t1 [Chlamydomonas eustigma]